MDKPKPKNLLDLMSPQDQQKAKRNAEKREKLKADKITKEWMMLSELGTYYGFDAIRAVLDDYIDIPQANMLVIGGRKMHSSDIYDSSLAHIAGNSTKMATYKKIMKRFIDDMKEVK